MKNLSFLVLLISFTISGFSTHQIEDYLIIRKDTFYLYESPLEQIDSISWSIYEINKSKELSSGCWRGFYAEWKIIDSILYLSKVFECGTDKIINTTIEKIVKHNFQNGLLKADWVNGECWCGNDIVWEQSPFMSIYRHERLLNINNGKIVNIHDINYIPCEYSDQEKLNQFIFSKMNWNSLPLFDGISISLEAYVETNSKGIIYKVKLIGIDNSRFDNEFIKAVKELPCMPVYFYKGEFWDIGHTIEIEINRENIQRYIH